MPLQRKAIYPIEVVLAAVGPEDQVFDGDPIHMDSLRYAVFKANRSCVCCGLRGEYFAKERQVNRKGVPFQSERYHFNLYGRNASGEEVLLTKDHIVPKSLGGKDILENLQTMCFPCNFAKGNKID